MGKQTVKYRPSFERFAIYMKRVSMSVCGFASALVSGVAVFGVLQFKSLGRETNNVPPRFNIQDAPVNREARTVTSYSPIIKRAAPSVVNIYSTRTVKVRRQPMLPFLEDPMFRQFFGDQFDRQQSPNLNPNPGRRGPRGNGSGGSSPEGQSLTRKEQSLGSGVIVSPEGYVLTANHVVEGADPNGVKVSLAAGGKEYTAKIIGTDPQTDVAVLKIDAQNVSAIAIADSDQLEVGDIVMAIGNPFGVGQTVTMGMVSALGRTSLDIIPGGYENFIQTDASINQGNSGGALIDAEGRLVGINTAIFSPSGGNAGIGFAVPVNLARSVMERLISSGTVTRGYLGLGLQPEITSKIAQQFNLPDQSGAMVTEVMPDTPAAKAGLQSGDVVRELNGKKITDRDQFRLTVSQMAPGTKVNLKILRSEPGGKPTERNIAVTLAALPGDLTSNHGKRNETNPDADSGEDSLDGVEVTDLDAQTRSQLKIPANVKGALVSNVEEGSTSAEAGLRQGDVILEINRQPVRNADDAVDLSRKAKGELTLLRVWRNGGSSFLTVENAKK
jgi:serine protease Do